MTLSEQFCLDRATAAQDAAADAALGNVRDQQLLAEASWRKLAAQANRLTTERDRREAVRLANAQAGVVKEDWDSPVLEDD